MSFSKLVVRLLNVSIYDYNSVLTLIINVFLKSIIASNNPVVSKSKPSISFNEVMNSDIPLAEVKSAERAFSKIAVL
jgi:hypothetical protein